MRQGDVTTAKAFHEGPYLESEFTWDVYLSNMVPVVELDARTRHLFEHSGKWCS